MGNTGPKQVNADKKGKAQVQTKQTQNSSPARRGRQQKFTQECVFDDDDRQAVKQEDRLQFIGLIRGKFKSKPQAHIGTGAIISPDLILTVGHNVCSINTREFRRYKEFLRTNIDSVLSSTTSSVSSQRQRQKLYLRSMSAQLVMNQFKHVEFAQWIEFYPSAGKLDGIGSLQQLGWRENKKAPCRIKQYKVHPFFITHPNPQMYDLCLLKLQTPLAPNHKAIRILEDYHNIATEISVFGYPLNLCFRQQPGGVMANQFGAKGKFTLDEQLGKISYRIATGSGQSGSPIFVNTQNQGRIEYFCIGVHNGGNQQLGMNNGVHLNEEKMMWLAEAQEQLTGKISRIAQGKLPKLPDNNVPIRGKKDVNEKSLEEYEAQIKRSDVFSQKEVRSKQKIYLYREAALLSLRQQSYQKAIQYYQSFIKLLEQMPEQERNEDDQDELEAAFINLAKLYCQIGEFRKSFQLYEEAEAKCKGLLRLSVQKQALILNNKGAVLINLDRNQQALSLFEMACKLRKERYGQEHLLTYNCLENIASVRCKIGILLNESILDYERVFKYKEKRQGVGSRQAVRTKANLALVLLGAKRYRQGLEGCHYCIEKLGLLPEKDDLTKFTKKFTQKMHELCRSDCTLQDLKQAFILCQKYELSQLSNALDLQWSKRRSSP